MAVPTRVVTGLFALMGLISGVLVIPLALLWMPLVFVCEGALFAAGFAAAYAICRKWLPRADLLQFGGAMVAVTLGYPLAIGFGAALSLASQWAMQRTGVMAVDAALAILGFMLLFGSVAAAMFVQMAVSMIVCEWSNAVFGMLVFAALATALISFGVYLPFYFSDNELVMRYRELALFGVMAPLGNAAFGAVCGWAMARSAVAESAMTVSAG